MTEQVLECQKRMLVDLIESYFAELLKKGKSWGDHIITSETWARIATIVNKNGPQKTADGWKLFYEKMKKEVKEKVGAQRRYINKTGSGIPPVQLNDVDIKISSLYGKNHFDGQQGLRECGFPGRKFISNPSLNDVSGKPMQSTVSETHFGINNSTSVTVNRGKKRSYDSRKIEPKKCDLCGGQVGSIECRYCNKVFCVACDGTYHRHPLRQTHNRKKVGGPDHDRSNVNGQSVECLQGSSGQVGGRQQADGRDALQPHQSEQSNKCDACGAPDRSFECRFCKNTYCVSCDQLHHTHPRRLWHIRKKVGNQ